MYLSRVSKLVQWLDNNNCIYSNDRNTRRGLKSSLKSVEEPKMMFQCKKNFILSVKPLKHVLGRQPGMFQVILKNLVYLENSDHHERFARV